MPLQTAPLLRNLWDAPLLRDVPEFFRPLLAGGARLLFLLVLFLVLRWLATRVVRRTVAAIAARDEVQAEGRVARVRTLAGLIQSVISYTLAFIFAVMALGVLGVNLAGILGTAGVAGLAVGFGAQKLVRDVITGFFLLLEDQYVVGDYVTISGVTGTVEELGMRITRIRDDEGRLYILSNGDIGPVCNQSRGPLGGFLEIGIAASADIARTTEVLNAAFAAADNGALGLREPARVEGIAAADASKTTLRVRFQTETGRRPGDVAARLRPIARDALLAAQIPLA